MKMTKEKFEEKYLNQLVSITFEDTFLPKTKAWISSEDEYEGHLKKNQNEYFLEEFYNDGIMKNASFQLSKIKEIKIVKK